MTCTAAYHVPAGLLAAMHARRAAANTLTPGSLEGLIGPSFRFPGPVGLFDAPIPDDHAARLELWGVLVRAGLIDSITPDEHLPTVTASRCWGSAGPIGEFVRRVTTELVQALPRAERFPSTPRTI